MIFFTQTKTTKCYGVTALWQMQLRHSVTVSLRHARRQMQLCNCVTASHRVLLMTLCSCVAVSLRQ